MRIIAGSLKSRIFKAPPSGKTHPMSERARGAIFNILGDISGARVLDAYAGSGALIFEAISRGAIGGVAVEINKNAYQTLLSNLTTLELESQIKAKRANVVSYLKSSQERFDLILLDPPYQLIRAEALVAIAQSLERQGRIVLSYPGLFESPFLPPDWQVLTSKSYAGANLVVVSPQSG